MAKKTRDKNQATGTALAEAPPQEEEERRDSYRVKLEIFEGPMDLLLFLIKKDEIEIADIPIAHITEQYLRYLELMQELDIAVAGDFLVLASTLIYIKSKMLLPPDPRIAGEEDLNEDPRAELIERLLEYQKYKSASQMLYSRLEVESAVYTRGSLDTDKSNPEVSATVFDLLRVFNEILKRAESKIEMEIARDEVTMAEKLQQIHALLDAHDEINVRDLFEMSRSKRELILTFLAFLELVKEWKVYILQHELFGEIFARKRTTPPDIFESEQAVESNEAETAAAVLAVETAMEDSVVEPVMAGLPANEIEANHEGIEEDV